MTYTLAKFQGELDTLLRKWEYFSCTSTSSETGLTAHMYTGHYGNSRFPPSLLVDHRFIRFPAVQEQFLSGFFTEDSAVIVSDLDLYSVTYVFKQSSPPSDSHGNSAVFRWNPVEEAPYDLLDTSMWVRSLGMIRSDEWIPVFYRPLAIDLEDVRSYLFLKSYIDPQNLSDKGDTVTLVKWVKWLVYTYQGMFSVVGEDFNWSPMCEETLDLLPEIIPFSWSLGLMHRDVDSAWINEKWQEFYDIQHS